MDTPFDTKEPEGLRWAIKRSFLQYVAGLPDGKAAIGDHVTAVGDSELLFAPAGDASSASPADGELKFSGEVRFGGHHGLLFVRIADPWIHLIDGAGELSVADPYLLDPRARVPLVTFTADPAAASEAAGWVATDVRLTADGAEIFNDVYKPGEPFESFRVTLPAAPVATSDGR